MRNIRKSIQVAQHSVAPAAPVSPTRRRQDWRTYALPELGLHCFDDSAFGILWYTHCANESLRIDTVHCSMCTTCLD
jgi:hypothetical protein